MDIKDQFTEWDVLHFGLNKNVKFCSLAHMTGQFEFGILRNLQENNAS